MRNSRPRSELEQADDPELELDLDSAKLRVLEHLAANPDTGYTPEGIAEQTVVVEDSVREVLPGLYEENLVEMLDEYYLINRRYVDAIVEALLDADQLQIAFEISDENTAPEEISTSQQEYEELIAEAQESIDVLEDM